jgi:hypothetical protein
METRGERMTTPPPSVRLWHRGTALAGSGGADHSPRDPARRARHAELLVLESLLPEGPEAHHAKVLDIVMLTLTGGRERTRRQYETLFDAAGFRLDRVVATAGPISVLVGIPA